MNNCYGRPMPSDPYEKEVSKIITHEQGTIPYLEGRKITEAIKKEYYFSSAEWWMWKMFQVGFAYGKRAERQRRKRNK